MALFVWPGMATMCLCLCVGIMYSVPLHASDARDCLIENKGIEISFGCLSGLVIISTHILPLYECRL